RHTRLGMPLYDVDQLILHPNKENANVPHGPEATNLTLAERIKKEYALLSVFSEEVADAHMRGDIHLHDLGFIDRPYCSGQSLEYIKRFGLSLPNSIAMAKPAKHAEVLLAHMVKFAAALQSNFAGAIGWDAVNLFFAPYLVGMRDEEVKQLAQMMIFEFSQQAVARGGQAIFTDLNLYWEIPRHFEDVQAVGPMGEYTGKTYSQYEHEAQRFAWFLFEVYREGDGSGRPFFFPKPLVHITEKFFRTRGHREFLHHICEVASEKGNTYFVFDRGETAKVSECCRLSFKLDASDLEDAKQPWKMRYCALQNVTLNLPRIGYLSGGDDRSLFEKVEEYMDADIQALWRRGEDVRGWARYWAMIYGHVAVALERDAALREATMVLRYEDLCERPEETMRGLLAHCRLDADENVIAEFAGKLQPPSYYRPDFSQGELAAIEEETAAVILTAGY
ncbi:MAG: hypothetical protein JSV19_04665, partial [Phycisphaerales bacterium]